MIKKDLLTRGVEEIIVKESLLKKLRSGRKLRIKYGIDPTTADLHLGYAVIFRKLRAFQELGHKVIFVIGDFTARFGDPTDKIRPRTLRDKKEVDEIAKTYTKQVQKVLDISKLEIRKNSEWYDKMKAEDLLKLASHFTTARLLERDFFEKRIKRKEEIRVHEIIYPILQAYDSVVLKADLTVIGSDQKFNELQARPLQRDFGQEPQDIITMPMLLGIDGQRKMSQSLNNYIGISEDPKNQYGKIMSIPDNLIIHYFTLLTNVSLEEIEEYKKALENEKVNPRDLKMKLAFKIVSWLHSEKKAQKAEDYFKRVFQQKKYPPQIPLIRLNKKEINIIDLILKTKLAKSKSEAYRLIKQRGIKLNKKPVEDPKFKVNLQKKGIILQRGSRYFVKVIP